MLEGKRATLRRQHFGVARLAHVAGRFAGRIGADKSSAPRGQRAAGPATEARAVDRIAHLVLELAQAILLAIDDGGGVVGWQAGAATARSLLLSAEGSPDPKDATERHEDTPSRQRPSGQLRRA